jgi:hypothetical protein
MKGGACMKVYTIRFGDRDALNEDLKPIRRRLLWYLIIGTVGTIFGINQLAKSSYISGRAGVMNDIQTEIDKQVVIRSLKEKEEQ